MKISDIERVKISDVDVAFAKQREELAKESSKLLGYTQIRTGATLLDKLHSMGIAPLKKADVQKYMSSKTKNFVRASTWRLTVHAAIVAALGFATYHYWTAPWSGAGLVLTVVGVLSFFPHAGEGPSPRRSIGWDSTGISNYRGIIPEFVLDRALQIKREVPSATFNVHYLVEHRERVTPKVLRDPFLEVSLWNESYFVDVWDEPEFEAKY